MESKIVFITGAGTGIGKSTVELFARKDWQVVATVRDPENYQKQFPQENVYVTTLDVSKPDTIQVAIEEIRKLYGRIDVVVNNAGYGLFGAFETLQPEEIRHQYDVNVFGLMNVCREIAPVMREQGYGCIVNISSMGGRFSVPYYSVYNSTKFAVEGFSEGLCYELEPFNVRVKIVEPGAIKTDFYGRSLKTGSRPEHAKAYSNITQKLTALYAGSGQSGSDPETVAKVIYNAATSRSNRLRYAAGADAHINIWAAKFLPNQIGMWLARRATMYKQ